MQSLPPRHKQVYLPNVDDRTVGLTRNEPKVSTTNTNENDQHHMVTRLSQVLPASPTRPWQINMFSEVQLRRQIAETCCKDLYPHRLTNPVELTVFGT